MPTINWDRGQTLPHNYWLRPAQAEDLPQLVDLLLTSFYPEQPFNSWLYPLMRLGVSEDIKRRLKNSSLQYACLVMINELDGRAHSTPIIVGTVEISLRSQLWQPLQPRHPYIANVAVNPHHRRQGIAQVMLNTCESISQTWGFKKLYLHVATDNAPAIALYQNIGYQLTHEFSFCQRRQMMMKQLSF